MTPHPKFVRSTALALAMLTVVALGAVTGCGAEEKVREKTEAAGEGAIEKAITEGEHGKDIDDVDVDAKAGTITFKGKEGTLLVGEDLAMPDGFPATLPLPEGGHSVNAVGAEAGVYEVTMFVTDPDLAAHEQRIRSGLEQAGYKIGVTETATGDGAEQRVVNGTGHGTAVAVRFSVALGRSSVHYSVKPQN